MLRPNTDINSQYPMGFRGANFGVAVRSVQGGPGALSARRFNADYIDAIPVGYRPSDSYAPAIKEGGMGVTFDGRSGGSVSSAPLEGTGNLATTITALGIVSSAAITGLKFMDALITAFGGFSNAGLLGPANLFALIRIGFQPSADEIAAAVWSRQMSLHSGETGTFGKTVSENIDGKISATLKKSTWLALK